MRVGILGAGAVGCLFGAYLVKAGHEVTMICRSEEKAKIIREGGITVYRPGFKGEFYHAKINAMTADGLENGGRGGEKDDDEEKFCLILVAVKSYDTYSAARSILGRFGDDCMVLSVQNGLGNMEILESLFGGGSVLGGVTYQASTSVELGRVIHASNGMTVIGSPGGFERGEILRKVQRTFNDSEIACMISDDILSVIWTKVVINSCINPITAMCRMKNGEILSHEGILELLHELALEGKRVAKGYGVSLDATDPYQSVLETARKTRENLSSMLQDVVRGKRTEVDYINGAIVARGRAVKIPTPINEILWRLVRELEVSGRFRTPDEIASIMLTTG